MVRVKVYLQRKKQFFSYVVCDYIIRRTFGVFHKNKIKVEIDGHKEKEGVREKWMCTKVSKTFFLRFDNPTGNYTTEVRSYFWRHNTPSPNSVLNNIYYINIHTHTPQIFHKSYTCVLCLIFVSWAVRKFIAIAVAVGITILLLLNTLWKL